MAATPAQLKVLRALIELYNARGGKEVRSRDLAEYMGKHEVSIRNALSVLKGMGLVQSKVGPGGGYAPTLKAMELARAPPAPVAIDALRLSRDGVKTSLTVISIDLLDLSGHSGKRAIVRVIGRLSEVKVGDRVRVGPTVFGRLVVEGKVAKISDERGELLLDVETIVSIPKARVGDVMSKELIVVEADATVKEAAELLHEHNIRAVPVVEAGAIIGLFLARDALKLFADGKGGERVGDVARREYYTIGVDSDIVEAVLKMQKYGVGRLIVTDETGKPVGMITRTDVLSKFASVFSIARP